MLCYNCKKDLRDNFAFCIYCGTKHKPSEFDLLDNSLHETNWQFYVTKGEDLASIHKYYEALEFFAKALEISSEESEIYNARGKCYLKMLCFKEVGYRNSQALDDFTTALKLNPNNLQTLINIGHAKSRLLKHNEAIIAFTKVLVKEPLNIDALTNRAIAKLNIQDYFGAQKDALTVIKQIPDHQYSLHILGNSLIHQGYFKKGISILKTVADKGYQLSINALNNLKQIQYLIVAEIDTKGFILKFTNNEENAIAFHKSVFGLSVDYPFDEMHKVEEKLKYIASYKVYGNEAYVGKGIICSSNGAYSVSVIKIDINTFCLKTFIKERENHSSVFNMEELSEEQVDKYPNINIIAN